MSKKATLKPQLSEHLENSLKRFSVCALDVQLSHSKKKKKEIHHINADMF